MESGEWDFFIFVLIEERRDFGGMELDGLKNEGLMWDEEVGGGGLVVADDG